VHANIAGADRAEHRVGQRVQPDIGVGMADNAGAVRNFYAAHHQPVARPERVHVETLADADIAVPSCHQPLGGGKVAGGRHLEIVIAAGDDQRRDPGRFSDRGVVG
jgi:hypothetical protein